MLQPYVPLKRSWDVSLKVEELPLYTRCNVQDIVNQFWALPDDQAHSCVLGEREWAAPFNRYGNVIPYDYNIVPIPPGYENPYGYINASFISTRTHARKFIACSAPLEHTITDFWSMVWHHKCTKIVALTRCTENGIEKSARYWPEKISIDCGDLKITKVAVKTTQDYTVTRLAVSDGQHQRYVVHFLYRAWPDHTIPLSNASFIVFLTLTEEFRDDDVVINDETNSYHGPANNSSVRKKEDLKNAEKDSSHRITSNCPPVVVHCSAGVGRTGTFIAIQILKEMGLKTGSVNVYNCVRMLRNFRMYMVQTCDQYNFIYSVLRDILCGNLNTDGDIILRHLCAYDSNLIAMCEETLIKLRAETGKVEGSQRQSFGGKKVTNTYSSGPLPDASPNRYVDTDKSYIFNYIKSGSLKIQGMLSRLNITNDQQPTIPNERKTLFSRVEMDKELEVPFEIHGAIMMVHTQFTSLLRDKRIEEKVLKFATRSEQPDNVYRVMATHIPYTEQELSLGVGDFVLRESNFGYWSSGYLWNAAACLDLGGAAYYPTQKCIKCDLDTLPVDEVDMGNVQFVCNYIESARVTFSQGSECVIKEIAKLCARDIKNLSPKVDNMPLRLVTVDVTHTWDCERLQVKLHDEHYKVILDYEARNISYCGMHPTLDRYFAIITRETTEKGKKEKPFKCHVFMADCSSKPIVDLLGTRIFPRFATPKEPYGIIPGVD